MPFCELDPRLSRTDERRAQSTRCTHDPSLRSVDMALSRYRPENLPRIRIQSVNANRAKIHFTPLIFRLFTSFRHKHHDMNWFTYLPLPTFSSLPFPALPVRLQKKLLSFLLRKSIGSFVKGQLAEDGIDLSQGNVTVSNLELLAEVSSLVLRAVPLPPISNPVLNIQINFRRSIRCWTHPSHSYRERLVLSRRR